MINSNRNPRRVIAVALLCALMTPLLADAGRTPAMRVEVVAGDESSGSVARVVGEAVTLRLGLRGIEADATDPEIAISGVSTLVRGDVRIELELFALDANWAGAHGDSPFAVVGVFPVDINLDRAVARLVDDLLGSAAPLIAEVVASRVDGPAVVDSTPPGGRQAPAAVPRSPGPPTVLPPAAEHPAKPVHVGLGVGFAPAVPALDAARYFGPSLAASAMLVWYPGGRERFGVGVVGRYLTADASGVATSARLSIVPFGFTTSVSTASARVTPYARGSAGMALIRADHPVLGQTQSLLPWGAAELGVRLAFGAVRMELGAGAEALLDGQTLLVAFVPAVGVSVVF